MITRLITLSALALATSQLHAQSHVHGQGQGFIAQEQDVWMINLTLPAADVLGFEHAPETDEERDTVKEFKTLLSNPNNTVKLAGNCKSVSTKLIFPEGEEDHDSHDHNEHHDDHDHDKHDHDKHDHDKHGHDNHDEHHEHDEHHDDHTDESATHSNVELTLEFSCSQNIEKIELPIFSALKSVETINFEWFTDKGQGAKQASHTAPYISF